MIPCLRFVGFQGCFVCCSCFCCVDGALGAASVEMDAFELVRWNPKTWDPRIIAEP